MDHSHLPFMFFEMVRLFAHGHDLDSKYQLFSTTSNIVLVQFPSL